jgi:glycosyltransferase involved in cell wall biosynthesis
MRPEKGIDTLIQALAGIPPNFDCKIIIIGKKNDSSYFDYCQSLASQLGQTERLIFWGERSDVAHILEGADLAVMPARSESGPLVLIEYTACGLPFVATAVGNISRQLIDLGVPAFVPPDNPEALAEALMQLLSLSSADLVERGKQGQEICLQHFDIRQKMPQWYRVYRQVFGEAGLH